MESQKQISAEFSLIANWVVWGLFVLEALVMMTLVKRKFYYLFSNCLNLVIIVALFPLWWAASSKYYASLQYVRFFVFLRLILPQVNIVQRVLSRNHFGCNAGIFSIVTVLSGILVTYIVSV